MLRKQAIEAKEGPWELRRRKAKVIHFGGRIGEPVRQVGSREGEHQEGHIF